MTETPPTADPIWEAVAQRDAAAVKRLLEEDPARARLRDPRGVSVVCHAAYTRNMDVLEALTALREDLDLHEAIAAGDLLRAAELLEAEPAMLHGYSPDGFPPLGLAAYLGWADIVDVLMDRGASLETPASNPMCVRPIHSAVASPDAATAFRITRRLLEAGALVNTVQQHKYTALHAAAKRGDARLVDLLLQYRADVNAKAMDGKTPADLAREAGHEAIAAKCAPTAPPAPSPPPA